MNLLKYKQELYLWIVRVNKADSAFLYFSFEANEGIAFYSTLDNHHEANFRDIQIKATPAYKEAVENLLHHLSKRFPLEIVEFKTLEEASHD